MTDPNAPAGLTDCHAHLCDAAFDADREAVLERAATAGVERVVAVGEGMADAERNLELAARHRQIRPAAGLFPTRLDEDEASRLLDFVRATAGRWTAIGEVGLDHWKVRSAAERALQRAIFERFIALALELDLPLNVHSRAAGAATIDVLRGAGARRVQLHAFDGRAARAQPALEAGYFFSVPPSIARSAQKQKLVQRLPLSSLLLETDSPVLGAVPQERNEPAAARVSLAWIAELKQVPLSEAAAAVIANTRCLYGEL